MTKQTTYSGIDYGLGTSNVDPKTGIRFGVIAQNSVMGEALDDLEPYYGDPHCPQCGNAVAEPTDQTANEEWDNGCEHGGCNDYVCISCELFWDSSECFPDESQGFTYERDGYSLADCLHTAIFVLKSPFYTYAQFCSPCVPGAGNLDTPCADGPKTYCLGHDWFDDGKAPYRVWRVSDDTEVTETA